LLGEEIFFMRPERYSGFISAGKTAIAVKFDLVEPFLALGKLLNRQRIHWIDEVNLGRREDAEVFCFHEVCGCQAFVLPAI
jgi:hypothetical protein